MSQVKTYTIEQKALTLVNTDPQRRCYDGHYYKSEWRWTEWSVLETGMPASRVHFWRNLNKIAVEARGKEARRKYRLVEEKIVGSS